MRFTAIPAAAVLIALTFTGCAASGTEYQNSTKLRHAFQDAGGDCDEVVVVPEAELVDGADGLICNPSASVVVTFEGSGSKDEWIKKMTKTAGDFVGAVGSNWVVLGTDEETAKKLGGEWRPGKGDDN